MKDGTRGYVCCRTKSAPPPCKFCGDIPGYQCDCPVGNGKTCDAWLCEECRIPIAENLDFCPTCFAREHERVQLPLEG
jgi:hypothetical protein